ncbi:YeeE/YedE family protein [Natranaerofaba carboxydovora]|uniref:YeeE/YedE family protein n=1 Tax=Natranaerofaba carboxydovora TaxID=2742683 RepID=UPI001F132DC8|nr:YeeE/YedE family protein [Natranaerofaba carboxydovora]UMZ75070.1 sulfur transport [Natranaerofaba carboxydovora]
MKTLKENKATNSKKALIYIITAIIFYFIAKYNYIIFFGILLGYTMQKSRFCFTAAFRDLFLIGNTSLFRGLIIILFLKTPLFALIYQYSSSSFNLSPVGLWTIIGAVLFSMGMVIAGACVTGSMVRLGEGYIMQQFSLLGILLGSVFGAFHVSFFERKFMFGPVFIPEYLNLTFVVLIQLFILAGLFIISLWLERGKEALSISAIKNSLIFSFPKDPCKKFWPYNMGAIFIVVIMSIMFLLYGTPWGITTSLTHLAGGIAGLFGIDISNWSFFGYESLFAHPLILVNLGIILGSFLSSFSSSEFRIRKPRSYKFIISGLMGGILMGYGARLAEGCNIGALISAIPSFSLHGWVFMFSSFIGAYIGSKILLSYLIE